MTIDAPVCFTTLAGSHWPPRFTKTGVPSGTVGWNEEPSVAGVSVVWLEPEQAASDRTSGRARARHVARSMVGSPWYASTGAEVTFDDDGGVPGSKFATVRRPRAGS